jgi:hypothetical protein
MSEHKFGWLKQFRDPRTANVLLNFELLSRLKLDFFNETNVLD